MKYIIVLVLITALFEMNAQDNNLPYYQIPDVPESYNAETTAARMIDGLGFRYYWGTEGLRDEDLSYRPSAEARTSQETIDHIYGLSITILNTVTSTPNGRRDPEELTFDQIRERTLLNFQKSSNLLKNGEYKLEDTSMIFGTGERKVEYDFWYLINGPIADAIWHVGQVVTFRRSSGNPFNSKASVLQGKLRD